MAGGLDSTAGQTQPERHTELLEGTEYATSTAFDALDRVTRHILSLDVEGQRRELCATYNRVGALEQVLLETSATSSGSSTTLNRSYEPVRS